MCLVCPSLGNGVVSKRLSSRATNVLRGSGILPPGAGGGWGSGVTASEKFPTQLRLALIVTEPSRQSGSPLQPSNRDPAGGAATRAPSEPAPEVPPEPT